MIGVFESVWAVLLTDRGAETWLIAVTLSIIVMPIIIIAPIGGRLAYRHGPLRVATVGIIAVVPCVVAYGFVESLVAMTAIAVLQGMGDAVIFPSAQVGAALAADEDQMASAQGLQGATLELVAGIMALGAGIGYERAGPEIVFVSAASLMVIGVVAANLIARPLVAERHPVAVGSSPGKVRA
jgi:MFS family permease